MPEKELPRSGYIVQIDANSGHIPKDIPIMATEEFTNDLEAVITGLRELLATLEKALGVGDERAYERQEAKAWLTRID